MKLKHCQKCGKLKPVEEFNRRTSAKDGLQSYCRACQRGYSLEHEEVTAEQLRVIDSHCQMHTLPNGVRYYHWERRFFK